jgi:hypothetical protein
MTCAEPVNGCAALREVREALAVGEQDQTTGQKVFRVMAELKRRPGLVRIGRPGHFSHGRGTGDCALVS